MRSKLERHRVRTSFYHIVGILYVLLSLYVLVTEGGSGVFWIGFVLFAADYVAEMYDPHPDNPGPFFKIHFHRFLEGNDNG